MSDDGRELEKPYRKLVEALIGLADVPLSSGDGKRDLAHAAARAIQRIANPWLELQIGKTDEERVGDILNEIRLHASLDSRGHEAANRDAVILVLAKHIAALEGQTRVIREPQMTPPPAPTSQPSPYSERKSPWGGVVTGTLPGASRVTLRNRLGDEWTVDDVPEGVPAIGRFRRHGLGHMSEVQFVLDEHCRKYGIMGKDRVFVEPARVVPELRAVRWTDESGEHEQVMGLEMAVVQLGNLRTEFAAFQKKANDEQARTEKKLADATASATTAWAKVTERDAKRREIVRGIGEVISRTHDLVDFATSVGEEAVRQAAE